MEVPLKRSDLINIFNGRVKVLAYPELMAVESLEGLFEGSYGNVIINYLTSEMYGHWVALKRRRNVISFFDSYGGKPDQQLTKIDKQVRIQLNEIQNRILYFIQTCGKKYIYEYNEIKYQQTGRETCGYWCVLFLKKRGGITEFQDYIASFGRVNLDDLVYNITTRDFF